MRRRDRLLRLVGPIAVVLVWQGWYSLGVLNKTLLASPWTSIQAAADLIWTRSIIPDLNASLTRMAIGYSLATIVGVTVGLAMGSIKALYTALSGIMDFFRSLPVTALYPVFVLIFGIGHESKIAMVFAASVWVIVLNSAYGVTQSAPTRSQMARLFGASRFQVYRWVVFREALPHILIGLRVAISYSLIVEIVCEMFMGTQRGIGQRVFEAYNTYAIDQLYGLVLIIGLLGYGVNRIFETVERRVVHWRQS